METNKNPVIRHLENGFFMMAPICALRRIAA